MTRITRLNPALRGDIEALLESHSRRETTQADLDRLPRDRREIDGEAFDPPVFGSSLYWGRDERPTSGRDARQILGWTAIIVALAVFGVLFVLVARAALNGEIRWS